VKVRQRYARAFGALMVALAASGALADLAAQQQAPLQRGQTPGPRFLVPILKSGEAGLGRQAGEAVRERMGDDFMLRSLWIIPKSDIENTLEASGYSRTEALNANDLKALAQLLRAEEYLDGTVTKGGPGFEFDGMVLLVRGEGMAQPLPKVTGAKLGDIAQGISSEVEKSRKQLANVQACLLSWRQNKYDEALAEANKAIKEYPNSVYARVCMLEIANSRKFGPDSIIRIAEEITKLHPQNRRALLLVADAYEAKKMEDKWITALTTLLAADPTNARLQETVVNALGQAGKPEVARPIIDEAVKQNPGDPSLIKLQWRIYLATKDFKEAVKIGEELIKADTAFADSAFWPRLVAAYLSAGDTAKAAEAAARGSAKFPQNVTLLLTQAQLARQAGQLPVALEAIDKVLAIDPKTPAANLQKAVILDQMGKPDEMQQALRVAVAAGDDKKTASGMMLASANKAYRAWSALPEKDVPGGMNVLKLLAFTDSLNDSETAKFLMGATELNLGQALLQDASKNKSCDSAKQANEMFVNSQQHTMKGGRAFPDQAKAIMDGLGQLQPYADKAIKALCKS
jgi:predicted Zn-dependent protease